MVNYKRHILDNGLTLLLHCDSDTPMVTVNTLWNVGARDENPDRTGFAHLFEHLMFGGTKRVPDYDAVVERMGGVSNAFTNNDYTNYYITVPCGYLEQALELEADRMGGLDFSQERLEVQQKVVTEEYNQRYMNQPYGDVWLLLRPMCFKRSPYRWCTIGADIRHVAEARLAEVVEFHDRYYGPQNAIVAVAGNIDEEKTLRMAERCFGGIKRHGGVGERTDGVAHAARRSYEREEKQNEERRLEVRRDVGSDALYKAYVMCGRMEEDFVTCDMISDVLSNGKSSRMYGRLVRDEGLFSEIDAYVTGDYGEGLFVVSGKLNKGVSFEKAEASVDEELEGLQTVSDDEMDKVASKYETTFVYSQYKASDRALSLCYYEWLGRTEWVNNEPELYRRVTTERLREVAAGLFRPEKGNVLGVKGI